MGANRSAHLGSLGKLGFNPRARVGRDGTSNTLSALCASFNPRARVGRDAVREKVQRLFEVSIHAPAWGATSR